MGVGNAAPSGIWPDPRLEMKKGSAWGAEHNGRPVGLKQVATVCELKVVKT